MADDDNEEKTEEPTSRRLDEAHKKGQVANSREVSNFFILFVFVLNIIWFMPYYLPPTVEILSKFIHSPHLYRVGDGGVNLMIFETLIEIGIYLALPVGATIIAALLASFVQHGFVISAEPIMPKLEKISVIKGLKRMFSLRSLMEFIKGIFKIILIATITYIVVHNDMDRINSLIHYDVAAIISLLFILSVKIVIASAALIAVLAALDFIYQRYEYIKSLKMSRQEIKDEFKQSEGDPQIKARLRQIRMERAQKRMMAAVPDADVVIRNPDHYAVALQYDQMSMDAPLVVALGHDEIALRIVEVAESADVPTVRNAPLARALFDSCELDQEIPLEHYQAVAEVISYVYRLKNKVANAA